MMLGWKCLGEVLSRRAEGVRAEGARAERCLASPRIAPCPRL